MSIQIIFKSFAPLNIHFCIELHHSIVQIALLEATATVINK